MNIATLQTATKKLQRCFFSLLLLLIAAVGSTQAQIPNCDGTVPTYNVNFVGNPGLVFNTPGVVRDGLCCVASNPDRCLHFTITMDTFTVALNFLITGGAIPPGALYYQVDCGPQQAVGSTICVVNTSGGIETHHLTFCKPGNNQNTYSVISVPRPVFRDDTVALGCRDTMRVLGLSDATTSWTSISPGTEGLYNNLLNCTSCARPVFTPTSLNPSVIQYRVCGQAVANQCVGTQIFCDTVTVNITSSFNPNPNDVFICPPGTTASLGAAPAGSSWSFLNGPVTPILNSSTGAVTGVTTNGTYNFLLRTSNGFCTDTVAIIRGSQPNAGTDQSICQPQTSASLGTAPSGQSWSVMAGNPAVATVGSSSGLVTGMTVIGTYNFILSSGSGGCGDTVAVLVKATPSAPTAVSATPNPICTGNTVQFNATGQGGSTWSWTGPQSFTSSLQNPTRLITATNMAGNYLVTQTVNGCTSLSSTVNLVVNATPIISSVTGANSTTCSGSQGTITIAGLIAGTTYIVNYTKGGVAQGPVSITADVSGNVIITGLSSGTYTAFSVSANGCSSAVNNTIVTLVEPTAPPAPTSATATANPICTGNTVQFNATTNQGGTITWAWTGPVSFTSSLQNPTRLITSTTMGGTYQVTQTINNCTSPPASVVLVVNATPVIASSSSTNPTTCGGSQGTITLTGLTAAVSYTVNYLRGATPQVATITADVSGNVIITGLTAGSYSNFTVTVVSSGCASNTLAGPIVLSDPSTPAAPSVGSNSPVCSGNSINLTATGQGGATYSWTGPSFSSSTQNPTILNATTAMSGSYCATQTVAGCTSVSACVTVTVNQTPAITSTASSNPTTCAGTQGTITLNGLVAGSTYTVNYTKTPGGAQGPVSILANGSGQVVIAGLGSGSYSNFTVAILGCTSANVAGPIVLSDPSTPAAPTVGSNSPVCSGNSINLTASGAGTSFSWTGPSFSSNSQNPSIPNATTAMSGSYCATQTLAGCTSPQACITVTVNQTPSVTSTASANPTTCLGTQGTITLNGLVAGSTYSVNYTKTPGGAQGPVSILANGTGQVIITGLGAGLYSNFTVTILGCTSSVVTGPIVLTDPSTPAAPTVGSNSPVCSGNSINLTATGTGGATYNWTGPSFSSATQNPTILSATIAMTGSYCATQTLAACTSPSACVSVTVNQTPSISSTSSSSPTTCSGTQGTITLNGLTANATYSVTYSRNGIAQGPFLLLANGSGQIIISGLNAGSYTNFVVSINGCPSSAVAGPVTLVDPTTPGAPTVGSNSPVCSGNSINLTATGTGGATFSWTGPSFTSSTQNPSIPNSTTAMTGSYCATQTVSGCTSVAACVSVTVNQTPAITTAVGSNPTTCLGNQGTITLSGLNASVSYTVTYNKNGAGQGPFTVTTNGSGQLIITGLTAGLYNSFVVTLVSTGCPSSAFGGSVTLSDPANPSAPILSSNSPRCYGDTLKLFGTLVSGATYAWTGPASFVSALQNPTRPNANPAMSGTYSVVVTVSNCSSSPATLSVTVTSCPPNAVNDSYTTPEDNPLTVAAAGILTNDNDPANPQQPLTVTTTPVCNPSHGAVTLNANGSFTYTPALNFNGIDSFCYRVCDNESPVACDTAVVFITVTPINDAPVVNNETITTPEDTPFTGTVATNDNDALDGTTLVYNTTPVSGPSHGTIVVSSNGAYTYTPTANYNGPDQVVIIACDQGLPLPAICRNDTIFITVTPVNDPPVVNNETITTPEDTPFSGTVATNDNDALDGTTLVYNTTPVSGPAHGTIVVSSNGAYTYTPASNYNGPDQVVILACDQGIPLPAICRNDTIFITVTPINDPPVVRDTTITTPEDNPISVCLPIADPETAIQSHLFQNYFCNPQNGTVGTVTVNNGSNPHTVCLTYTPNADFNGSDSICLIICDNGLPQLCDTATIHITVTPVNDKPNAVDDYFVSCTGAAITNNVLTNDFDIDGPSVTVTGNILGMGPYSGTLNSLLANGNFTYTPPSPVFNGIDSFVYIICDGGSPNLCDTATVVLDYRCVNVPPIALNDGYTTNEDQTLNGDVSTNDNDPDGNVLNYNSSPVVNVAHGTLTLNTDGTFTYVPTPNYFGSDSFVYAVCDTGTPVKCDTATVYITVLPVNDPPVVRDTTITTPEDVPFTVCLPIADIESFDLHVSAINCSPANGVLSALTVNNLSNPHEVCITYTPNPNYNGSDSFCLLVCDNGTPSRCDTAVVYISVTPVNDPPIAVNDNYSTNEDVTLVTSSVTGVRNNDNDNADGNAVTTLSITTTPVINVVHGTLSLSADGSFTYVPTSNYCGTDSFRYRVCDNGTPLPSLCDTGTAYITINCVNDPPVVIDTPITQCEDCGPITVCIPVTDNDPGQQHFIAATYCGPNSGSISSTLNGPSFDVLCVTYTPNLNFNGNDSICIIVCDNGSPVLCDTTHISITVTPVNDPPIAVNDNYSTNEDVTLVTSSITGVRNNDNDNADGNAVTTLSVTTTPVINVVHGTLSLSTDGHFTYIPTSNYCGTDSFQYRVCDNGTPLPSLCDTGTAYITINCVNDPPVVIDTAITQCEDCGPITVCIPVVDNDANTVTTIAGTFCGPNSGTVSTNLVMNTLCVTYTANTNFNGQDSICLVICDNGVPQLCDTTHITITITPVNDPPIAVNDNYTTSEDAALITSSVTGVRNNDNDNADGNAVTTLTVNTTPLVNVSNGTLVLNSDGSFTYTPNLNFNGTDSFQYVVCDNGTPLPSLCDTATAYITVTPQNDPPVVNDTTVTVPEDGTITVCLPIIDPENGTQQHTVSICDVPDFGVITSGPTVSNLTNTVCITYQPNLNFNGVDSICLTICDNGIPALCDNAVIHIIVTPVNDPPVAVNDNYTTSENATLTTTSATGVRINDNDNLDGNPVTSLSVNTTPLVDVTHGTLTLNSDGSFTYVPDANYNGTDSFVYIICDSGTPLPALCDTATAYITIVNVNYPPIVPDTTVTTPADNPLVICIPISDQDALDTHTFSQCGGPVNGTATGMVISGSNPQTLCFTYTPYANLNGTDSMCIIVCDNGSPQLCDTTHITIIVTPVNDPPFADTIYVVTYENNPVGVNTAAATGDLEGDPLSYSYGAVTPNNGTYGITGNGAIVVTPNPGFTGNFSIPYGVCDLSPYPVNVLCDNAVIFVTVLPAGDTLNNHAPVASNDYVTTPLNNAVVINELANDYDVDGDPLSVTIVGLPLHGAVTVNPDGSVNYTPNTGYFGFDTIHYVICDPVGTTQPRPLCDDAYIFISISRDIEAIANDPPVAVDDFGFICADASSTQHVLLNDNDPNGDAITSAVIIRNFSNGSSSNPGFGLFIYTPNSGFSGNDTMEYRICDNGSPSLCDTGSVIIMVRPTPVISSSVASLDNCSGDPVNISFSSNVPGTVFAWSATDGTNGTGNISTTLSNNTSNSVTVTYTVTGVAGGGCGSNTLSIPVTVKPRPTVSFTQNNTIFCSGEQVFINVSSNIPGTTFTWAGSNGASGNGNIITDNPVNSGTTDITVTYTINSLLNGCSGTPVTVSVTVKPKPVLSTDPSSQTICSGTPITINISTTVPGTSVNWTGSNGNSGNVLTITDSPINLGGSNIVVTYTVNGQFNGCAANTTTATVTVRPKVNADAGQDKTIAACAASCVTIGGSPTGSAGSGALTYHWNPITGLNDTAAANPIACNVSSTTTYIVTVTDASGCSATDAMTLTSIPSSLTAEAGNGGALCSGTGDSVMLGGFPTAVGGTPAYTYTWSPSGLNLTNPANPFAFPATTTKYYLTVTDALGCISIDSTIVTVYPVLTANAGADTAICATFNAQLGGNPTASGGSGSGYSYVWSPTVGISSVNAANPTASPVAITTYTVFVVDANGCSASDNIVVTIRANPIAQAGPDKTLVNCSGDSVTIGDNPAAISGTGSYTYSWTPSTGLNSANVPNPVVKGILTTTTYTLSVTDASGCVSTDNVTVNLVPSSLQAQAGSNKTVCSDNTCLQIGGIPTAVGGTTPYYYAWSNGSSLLDSTASNPFACPLATTTYTVTITDSKACSATSTMLFIVNPIPTANAGVDTAVCSGSSVVIGGTPTGSGGTAAYTYAWTPTIGLSLPNIANPSASPIVITTYQVTVTDSKGCTASDAVTVTPRTNPVADAGSDKIMVNCSGDSTFIGGLPTVVGGGTPPYSCVWSPDFGLSQDSTCNPTVYGTAIGLGSHSYQLVVRDVYGCVGVDYMIVDVIPSTLQADAGNNGSLCSNSNGTITIGGNPTAAGGIGPFNFTWTSSPAGFSSILPNPQVSPIVTTTYYVTVMDSKGCISTDSVKVFIHAAPSANAGNDTTLCSGFCVTLGSGSTGTGGTPPYQYLWAPTIGLNANNTPNPLSCPLITTTFNVQVTDSNGCVINDAVTVTIRPVPVANAGTDASMTTCGGDSVRIGGTPAASGGTSGYTYMWSPATGLYPDTTVSNPWVKGISTSGLYTLKVTDANGCTAEDAVAITVVPSTLSADAGNDGAYCTASGSSVTLGGGTTALGGAPLYTFSWSPSTGLSSTTVAHPVANPTTTQTYYVTVTDSKGCIAVDSVTITVYPSPIADAGSDTAVCSGKPVLLGGEPTASTGGQGSGTFTYSWSPTIGLSSSTASNPTATTTVTTTYVVTVTDENGCTASDAIQITIRANPIADAGPDKTLVACSADSVRLGGSPTASNGGGTYTYSWTPGTNPPLSSGTVPNPYASHLGSTTSFTVVVTDQFGCSATDQVAVQVTNPTLIANAGNDVSFCQGASVSVTLGSTPTALGGTLPYTYTWTPGATLTPDSTRANPVATPTQTTTYTVVVRDASGCVASDTVRVTINPRPVVSAGLPDTICAGECVVLGGTPTASAGTGSYTYNWTPSLFITGSTTSSNPTACPTSPITYQVTATDSLGCSNNASISIRVNQNPFANAGADKSLVACPEACVTIGGSPTASGGGGGYLYAWAPSAGLNNTGLPNPSACNLSQSVTYSLTLTDANGCTATDQVFVSVSQSTLRADAGPDKSICAGTTNCVSIGGINSVQGATGSYVIDWSPTGGICDANNIPNPMVNPTDTTTYVLLVTDSLGCVAIDSMVLYANPAVTASVEPDTAICSGGSALLGGIPTGSGGTPNYTYSWSGGTLTNPTSANPVASPVSTTSYCVTVTDKVGCSASTCQTVIVNQAVFADAGPDQTMTFCPGSYVIIGGSPTGAGGTGNFSYQWSPDSVGGVPVLFSPTIPNPIISGLSQTTTFSVTVTDNVTKCFAIDQVKITVNQSTLTADAGLNKTFCSNSSSCVLVGGNPTASGGVFQYTYQWAPIVGLNDGTISNPCASPINTTTYHVTVYDNLGCFQEDSMTVIVSPLIAVNAGNDVTLCSGTTLVLGAIPPVVGGTTPYVYSWSGGAFPTNVANPTVTPLTNSSYTLTVVDSLGCSASDLINVSVRALPIANAGANAIITACSSDSAVLGGIPTGSGTTPPYTYSWSPPTALNNSTFSNPVVSQLGNTTQYCVVVTDTFGCSSLPSCATVTVLPVSIIVDAGATQSLCSNVAGCVTLGGAVPVNGGAGPYTYNWLGGALPSNVNHPSACPLATTTYTLVVTDNNGCQSSDTVLVIVNQPTEASISGLNTQYCINSGNVIMTGIPSGGTFSGPFVTGNVFQPIAVGLWCLTYTYTNPATGCVDDTVVCVQVDPLPVVSATGFNANYCRYDNPFTITGSPVGGTFSGSPGVDFSGLFTPANATVGNNVITYTYLDEQTGCTNTYTFTINVKDAPTLDLSASADTVCAAGCVTVDATYSIDVFNISYTQIGGGNVHSGLGSWSYCPTLADVSIVGTAVNTPNGCITRDTLTFHVNQPPVAVYDEASTCEEIQVFIPELSNDSDPEGDNNTITIITTGHGTTTVGSGLLIYTPAPNFNGIDTILYLLCNANCPNSCDTGTVQVVVCPVNDPPVILDTTITIYENDTADVCPFIFDVDGDALIISDAQCTPLNGTIVMTNDSCFEFVPTPGWTGTQVLCIAVCDPSGLCDTATITINVIGINHRPHAVKVNRTVCLNTSIGINVSAGAGDPDADPLNFTYLSAVAPPGAYTLTVNGNGAIVFSGTAAGYYHIPYIVCDVTNRYPGSLCDTDEIVVRVIICDSLNAPPVANDDYANTCDSTNTVINVVANDYDPDGDALNVTLLCPPSLAGATAILNANGTVNYSSPVVGLDSICYVICDPYNACDTAVTYIYVNVVCGTNHPPVAVDDFDSTNYITTVVVDVLGNDHDPDGNPISIVSIPCPPIYGTATIASGVITYTPGPNANAHQPDTFCYVIQDIYGAFDTAYVVIYIKNSVQAINDTVQTGNYVPITIDVMNNDFDPELDSFYVTGVITTGTVGTVTLNADGTVTYIPDSDTCGFIDAFQYTVQDTLGAVDTATVYITIICCPLPVAMLDTALVLAGDSLLMNPALNDTGSSLTAAIVTAPLHGTATVNANGVVTYKPAPAYCGYDTLAYSIANTCGADTGFIIVNVSCNLPPNAVKNALTMCVNDTASVDVLLNDSDPDGNTLTITGFSNPFPAGLGQITGVSGGVVSFQSGTTPGTFSLNYYVCDNGLPSKCDTANLIVRVVPCTPIHVDTIYDNTCLNTADTICAGNAITGTNNPTITTICTSQNASVSLIGGNCIAYMPNNGFFGIDTFCIVVCDTLGHCDTSAVLMATVDCLIQAVDEPCDLDTAYMNVPFTLGVLANDIIPFGIDTSVTLVSNPTNGTALVNANYTVTYTPNTNFTGTESFVYQVCVITGRDSFCSRAKICITVVDTTVECYIPNGFSPNGDGVNEEFTIPCNSRYPLSTLRIYDRWGVEVWFSDGPYQNDFGGKNKQGTVLPDGTYYLIYEYNDGTGRREAKFVVINR